MTPFKGRSGRLLLSACLGLLLGLAAVLLLRRQGAFSPGAYSGDESWRELNDEELEA